MNKDSTAYTVGFAAAVCIVCALLVATAAVVLAPRQAANQKLYVQKNVLLAAGLLKPTDSPTPAEVLALYAQRIRPRLVDLAAGRLLPADQIDASTYDQRRARNDPAASRAAPENRAGIARVPNYALAFFVMDGERVDQVVLSVEGLGMWGTIYGFVSLDADGNTVRGLTYYDQKETPGLGGEIGNPKWQALWHGRRAFDDRWEAKITVIKGTAGPPDSDPLRVDGLSGATVTSNAITRLMQFWLGEPGYGRWLREFREGRSST